jgi:hypothetical protein
MHEIFQQKYIQMHHSDKASVMGFQILTVLSLRVQVFRDVTLDCWVSGSRGFRVNCAFICMGPAALEEFLSGLLGPVGRDSSVGIATRYELDGLGIESR